MKFHHQRFHRVDLDTGLTLSLCIGSFSVSPGWLKKPEDISVTEGQSSMLDCQTTGSPTPVLTWMKSLGNHDRISNTFI